MINVDNSNRTLAIDFLRGATVAFMIVVNSPGSFDFIYPPLKHAIWHGFTPTDMVFPTFMFVIGLSMWVSFGKFGRQWGPGIARKILYRTAVLFLIGLLLNKFPYYWKDWSSWRIMGVPQRLALGYGLASVLVLSFSRKSLFAISALMLLGYWGLLYFYASDPALPYEAANSAVLRLDKWLFGEAHLYREWVAPGLQIPFDPEGMLSTLPAIVTVLLGWFSGEFMSYRKDQQDRLVRDLAMFGVACIFIGLIWDLGFPINKKLWTSSYVMLAGGVSISLLAGSIWLVELRHWRNGTGFFFAFGLNTLFAYVLSELLFTLLNIITFSDENAAKISVREWLFSHVFQPLAGQELGSLLFAVSLMGCCWACCRILMVRNILIKI